MKNLTNEEYKTLIEEKIPKSSIFIKSLRAFVSGGLFCVIAQIISNLIINYGISQENAASFTSVSMVFLGSLLTGLNVYDDIAKFAGAGSLVPITGFSNAITSPAMEFKNEGFIMGVGAKIFVIAGPVIVYGVVTSIVCGLFLIISKFIF